MLKILPAVNVGEGFSRKGYRNDVLVLPSNYIEFAVSQWSPMEWAALLYIKAVGEGTGWTSIPPARFFPGIVVFTFSWLV